MPVKSIASDVKNLTDTSKAVSSEKHTKELYNLHQLLLQSMAEVVRLNRPSPPHNVAVSMDSGGRPVVVVDGVARYLAERPLRALLALADLRDREIFLAAEFANRYAGTQVKMDAKATKDTFFRPVAELKKELPRLNEVGDKALKRAGYRSVWGLQFTINCKPEQLQEALTLLRSTKEGSPTVQPRSR